MATLHSLLEKGDLIKIDPCLDANCLESRIIYALERPIRWLNEELPKLESTWNIQESPAEQADSLIAEFCGGESLGFNERFHALRPEDKGVWELKTGDLRFFGWFYRRDIFILSDCDHADRIKQLKMYKPYLDQTVRFRTLLDLDEPKFIEGKKPGDVISNFHQA